MTRTQWLGFIALSLSLTLLTGCLSDFAAKKNQDPSNRTTDEKLFNSLKAIRESEKSKPSKTSSEAVFNRRLSLSFQPSEQSLTEHHSKIIQLFFQTLPPDVSMKIVINVAPTASSGNYSSLQTVWKRLRSLEDAVSGYSEKVELIYQPDFVPDTATLQIVGG